MPHVLDPVSPTQIPTGTIAQPLKSSAAPGPISVRWIDSAEELEAIKPQWNELAENAVYRNAALEQNFLIPAFKHLNDGNVRVLVAESSSGLPANAQPKLLGLLPVVKKKFYHLPIACLEVWKHDQCTDSTPLPDKASALQALDAMLDFLSAEKIGLLSLDTISAEPDFQSLLHEAVRQRNRTLFLRDSFTRAALRPSDNSEDYVKQFVSKSVQKNYGRLQRRLSELGELSFELSDDFSDYPELTRQFLDIEASGWKVEAGTALSCNKSTKRFYQELILRSAQVGKARFTSLKLDGKPIAMLSDIQSGQTVFRYKTAFDENFSAYSPGVQVEIKNIEYQHQSGVVLTDSCTAPDNATINRIFGQKLQFQSIVLGLRPGISRIATRMLPWIQATANRLRS